MTVTSYDSHLWPNFSVTLERGEVDGDRTQTTFTVRSLDSMIEVSPGGDVTTIEVHGELERMALAEILGRLAADLAAKAPN